MQDPCWAAILFMQAHVKYGIDCVTNRYNRTAPLNPPYFGG